MWFKRACWSICGAALLVALAAPAAAEDAPTVEGAANTFAGILGKPDPRGCLPGGGLTLLGVKHADVGMKGWTRLRTDNPLRLRERESYEKVQKQGAALAPVEKKANDLSSEVTGLQSAIPDLDKKIEGLKESLRIEREDKKPSEERIARLTEEISKESAKLAEWRARLNKAESELGPARLEQARLEQAYKAAKATNNADYKAAEAAGNACP